MAYQDIRDLCRRTYREYVEKRVDDTELRRALRTHERVPAFIDNLARELGRLESNVKRETIERAVTDMTAMFVGLAKRQFHERVMSKLAIGLHEKREREKEEFRREVDALERKGTESVTQDKTGETVHHVIEV